MNPAPTLEQVAAIAGVSRATASRVVNGSDKVAPAIREAVEKAIAEIGYIPNRAARSLVTRRTNSVAFVVREPDDYLFQNPFFGEVIRGAHTVLDDAGIQMVLMMGRSADDKNLERYLTGGHVDGALFIMLHGKDELPLRIERAGIAVALGGRPLGGYPISYVDVDNVAGSDSAVCALVAMGRRTIATVTGPLDTIAGKHRLDGYRQGLRKSGLSVEKSLIVDGAFTREGAISATNRLLDARPDVDAIFAASDLISLGVLEVLRSRKRRVPRDIAIIGFDDSILARSTNPPLSTVRQPIAELGAEMARIVLRRIAGGDLERKILRTELVLRESTPKLEMPKGPRD